jgi:hypothetical protein
MNILKLFFSFLIVLTFGLEGVGALAAEVPSALITLDGWRYADLRAKTIHFYFTQFIKDNEKDALYTVTCASRSKGKRLASSRVSPIVLEGLVGGVEYRCAIQGKNASKVTFESNTMTLFPVFGDISRLTQKNQTLLELPPQFQWKTNYGYCAETALKSAALYFGQYISQYDIRALASPGKRQSDKSSQVLLGVNEDFVANALHLKIDSWKGSGSKPFLSWIKKNTLLQYPVSMGVFENMSHFEGDEDLEYDHIVSVLGFGSEYPLSDFQYHDSDELYFSDNGLLGDDTASNSPYFLNVRFSDIQKSRVTANLPSAPFYSIAQSQKNYGFAVIGVVDRDNETLPVRLTTSHNFEFPEIKNKTTQRPKPAPLTLSITVSGLKPGVEYNLYRYSRVEQVPQGSFNANAKNADKKWFISHTSGTTFTTSETLMSNEMAFYRAVPVSAR